MGGYKRDIALLLIGNGVATLVGILGNTPLGILLAVLFTIAGIVLLLVDYKKNRTRNTLTDADTKYMARLNKELQNISDYYQALAEGVNVSKISQAKVKRLDTMAHVHLGLKTITSSKPTKSSEKFKGFCFLFYDLFKVLCLFIRFKFDSSYLLGVFLDLGSIPDDIGIGLSSCDTRGEQLTKRLLRVVGERISSNETITSILRCKDACYAMNNIYLWFLMYPKGHKKIRMDFKKLIRILYGFREKMMAYAFADVNKAIIKEFLRA
ncbi:MAG: hypothetical protein ABIH70_01665 [Chloroflexota bacterium]